MEDGRCQLFCQGILQLSWKEVDGDKKDGYLLYNDGIVVRSEQWSGYNSSEHRYIENSQNGLELIVENNGIIYQGGFDNVESMKREGRGILLDEKSKRMLQCGVWKNDKLFQITQLFESEEAMIEFEVEEGKENVTLWNRHPVYRGGFVFDEEKGVAVRHGKGCEIENGIVKREGIWEMGRLTESADLFDGWYLNTQERSNIRIGQSVSKVMGVRVELHSLKEWEGVYERVEELVVPSNGCNDTEMKVFDVSPLKKLKSIEIGNDCFVNVDEVKMVGLKELERVVIGDCCFTQSKKRAGQNPYRYFCLKSCSALRKLQIGSRSFSDYCHCEIDDLSSVETIHMGVLDENYRAYCFFHSSLEIKSTPCG